MSNKLLYASFALAVIFGILQVLYVSMTNDTNMFVHNAYQMLSYGTLFYEHSIDVNPPLYILLDVPVVLLSEYTHIQPGHILHLFCLAACILSLTSLNHVLRVHAINDTDRNLWLAAATFALIVSPILFGVYADRDHLLFVLTLPWLVQMLLRTKPLAYTCILASIGFCIKPYDIIIFFAMTLAGGPAEWSLLQRIFSTSARIIAATTLAYWTAIDLFFPFYIHTILPVALLTYSSITINIKGDNPYANFKTEHDMYFIIYMLAIASCCMQRLKQSLHWYALILSCFIVYNLNAGWGYTSYLLFFPLVLLSTLPFQAVYKTQRDIKNIRIFTAYIFAACIFFSVSSLVKNINYSRVEGYGFNKNLSHEKYTRLREEIEEEFIPVSALFWGSNIETIGGAPKCVFAYCGFWSLHWLYLHPADPRFIRVLHTLTMPLANAMEEHPSAVLIVDTSPDLAVYPYQDLMTFLKQDTTIRGILSQYAPFDTIDECNSAQKRDCSYTLWRRKAQK